MYILSRPLEIMVLVGLNAVVGAILLMNGLSTGGVEFPSALPSLGPEISSIVGSVMSILGTFELPLAFAFFGSAAGLFLGKGWGWTMSRTLQVIGIAFGFAFLYDAGGALQTMGLYALSMSMGGVVIGLLYAPEVREFYGKIPVAQAKRQRRRRKQDVSEEEDQESSAAEVE